MESKKLNKLNEKKNDLKKRANGNECSSKCIAHFNGYSASKVKRTSKRLEAFCSKFLSLTLIDVHSSRAYCLNGSYYGRWKLVVSMRMENES